jgi:hypothetical protein
LNLTLHFGRWQLEQKQILLLRGALHDMAVGICRVSKMLIFHIWRKNLNMN